MPSGEKKPKQLTPRAILQSKKALLFWTLNRPDIPRDFLNSCAVYGGIGTVFACAAERRFRLAGASSAWQPALPPVAIGAGHGGNDMD